MDIGKPIFIKLGVCGEILGSAFTADSSQNRLLIAAVSADVNSELIVQREDDASIEWEERDMLL